MTAASEHGSEQILITPRSLTAAGVDLIPELDPLREAGYRLITPSEPRVPSSAELLELLPDCVGWLAGIEAIPAEVLRAAPRLRVISRNGTGIDSIDLPAATAAGIEIRRAAGANAQGVAELALTLALSCLRNVSWSAASVADGGWRRWQGRELADTTVGIIGLGAIGRKVAAIFGALGATVVGHDPFVTGCNFELMSLDDLMARADVVTLHAPPPADGSPLITASRLAKAPADAILVNTARASLVDDDAVLSALDDGRLAAYAVDAFDTEPPKLTPLLRHERVLATPHLGGYTGGSVSRATRHAVANLLEVLTSSLRR